MPEIEILSLRKTTAVDCAFADELVRELQVREDLMGGKRTQHETKREVTVKVFRRWMGEKKKTQQYALEILASGGGNLDEEQKEKGKTNWDRVRAMTAGGGGGGTGNY